MLKGLALTPPVVGRISIGRVVERNGKRLPEKDDEFTVTTQVHAREGWIPHPVDQALLDQAGRRGLECGAFEDSAEDGASVVEELFPIEGNTLGHIVPASGNTPTLAQKLAQRAGDRPAAEAQSASAGTQGGGDA